MDPAAWSIRLCCSATRVSDTAAGGDAMEEGTSKAIPLRRSRATTRALTVRPGRWVEGLRTGVRQVIEPPRQVWLASLGGTAVTVRGVRELWSLLVSEGAAAESALLRVFRRSETRG